MAVPFPSLTEALTLYHPIAKITQYCFRFRQGALSNVFGFSRLTPKRGYAPCRVVPRWKGHVTPYKTVQKSRGYL